MMHQHISPFVCSNVTEFGEERAMLRERTFPKLKEKLAHIGIQFDPVQLDYTHTNAYLKSGHLLRLLLANIRRSAPFFIGLVGFKYGTHLNNNNNNNETTSILQPNSSSLNSNSGRRRVSEANAASAAGANETLDWFEKNLQIAAQTGFSHIINSSTSGDSFLEHQINLALAEPNTDFFRFYFRQYEYLEEKFAHLPLEARREAIRSMEAEDDVAKRKLDELKMRLAKRGISIKYYRTLDQLNRLVLEDFEEIFQVHLRSFDFGKSLNSLYIDNLVRRKMENYVVTNVLKDALKKVEMFLKQRPAYSVHFKLDEYQQQKQQLKEDDLDEYNQIETVEGSISNDDRDDYLEVLRLRHSNISTRIGSYYSSQRSNSKQIMLITGERGKGKTSFMTYLYQMYALGMVATPNLSDTNSEKSTSNSSSSTSSNRKKNPPSEPFYLFYFLKPDDYLINILINVTCKMRLKYLKKNSKTTLDQDLHDRRSILEQFQAALSLGPLCLFIDGLSELAHDHTIPLVTWFPTKLDAECKLVFTMNRASEFFVELANKKQTQLLELRTFENDADYRLMFAKFYALDPDNHQYSSANTLYAKFLAHFHELKTSSHIDSPLFVTLIAQEIFTFDRDIHQTHPIYLLNDLVSEVSSLVGDPTIIDEQASITSNSTQSHHPVNVMNSYVEEVSTIREIIQKILKRSLKKNNWSVNLGLPLSTENSGWVGDVLCLISISPNGFTKDDLMRILDLKGYKDKLKITDLDWAIFRMRFGNFIVTDHFGNLTFSHDYFKEAVQALLLDGFSVMLEFKLAPNLPPSKKNISDKQKKLHFFVILDILKNRLNKLEFDYCVQIDCAKSKLESNRRQKRDALEHKYLKIIHELIFHTYMAYDLINLCKILTNFKILHLFNKHRMTFLKEWNDLLELFRLTTNFDVLRSIMLSSLIIGIPHYQIDFNESELTLDIKIRQNRNSEEEDEDCRREEPTNNQILDSAATERKSYRMSNNEEENNNNNNEEDEIRGKNEDFQTMSAAAFFLVDQLSDNIDPSDFIQLYEPLIDKLLDLTDSIDLSKTKYGDTVNLMLVNRCLLLVDLVRNLGDRRFLENYSFLLCTKIHDIINENFPLNEIEKLKFTHLLQMLGNMSLQVNNYDMALKYFLKCVETSEDLFESFHLLKLEKRMKNRWQLFQLGNRLSYLYSNIALIMLKLNSLKTVEALLVKANSYSSDKLSLAFETYKKREKSEKNARKFELETRERRDPNRLIYRPTISDIASTKSTTPSVSTNLDLLDSDDGASYNPRRAELYLRKSLNIKQLQLEWDATLKTVYTTEPSLKSIDIIQADEPRRRDENIPEHKLNLAEEENTMAEILFDLGCLLATYNSLISKNEALDCLRRALDIKSLHLGANHSDCQIIKSTLTEATVETAQFQQEQNLRGELESSGGESSFRALMSRVASSGQVTQRSLQDSSSAASEVNKQGRKSARPSGVHRGLLLRSKVGEKNELDAWIERNSVVELIPAKAYAATIVGGSRKATNSSGSDFLQQSQMMTSDESQSQNISLATTNQIEDVKKLNTEKKFSLSRSLSLSASKTNSIHLNKCRCPTVVSIDIHNVRTINGPNSTLRKLMDVDAPVSAATTRQKILKHIYYKSAWYDFPPGSSKRRFRNFVKLTPNA